MTENSNDTDSSDENFLRGAITEFDADILVLNSPMGAGVSDKVRALLEKQQTLKPNVVLLLVTSGGLADEAYRIGRMLQSEYEKVTVCIAGWCKSAGTLLAIAGHELIIGPRGELGPLDVQLAKRDELFDRDSGLISNAALDRLREESFQTFEQFMLQIIARSQNAITFRTAADVAAEITVGVMRPVFDKIDPLQLGTDARAMDIGSAYALRLNLAADNLRGTEALNMLVNGYPSHSFVIDYGEANVLFTNVKPLTGNLLLVVDALAEHVTNPSDEPVICFLDEPGDEDGKADDDEARSDVEDRAAAANDENGEEPPEQLRENL